MDKHPRPWRVEGTIIFDANNNNTVITAYAALVETLEFIVSQVNAASPSAGPTLTIAEEDALMKATAEALGKFRCNCPADAYDCVSSPVHIREFSAYIWDAAKRRASGPTPGSEWEAFEKLIVEKSGFQGMSLPKEHILPGIYVNPFMQAAWEGWQAARAASSNTGLMPSCLRTMEGEWDGLRKKIIRYRELLDDWGVTFNWKNWRTDTEHVNDEHVFELMEKTCGLDIDTDAEGVIVSREYLAKCGAQSARIRTLEEALREIADPPEMHGDPAWLKSRAREALSSLKKEK